MAEVRFELPDGDMAVLDGYCSATGKSRTDVIRSLIGVWAGDKLHEATVILRVVNGQSGGSDKRPEVPRSNDGGVSKVWAESGGG